MNRKAQTKLLTELSYENIINCNILKSKVAEKRYLNYIISLYEDFVNELDGNLKLIHNFPEAYVYLKELDFEVQSLERYYMVNQMDLPAILSCVDKNPEDVLKYLQTAVRFQNRMERKVQKFVSFKIDLVRELRTEFFGLYEANSSSNIKWNLTHTDFVEFSMLLMRSGTIGGLDSRLTLTQTVKELGQVMNIQVKGVHSKLSKAKDRKKDPVPNVYRLLRNVIDEEHE